jgi:hypothetical protein
MHKAASGQSFLCQPEALAVLRQHPERGRPAAPKNKEATGKRVGGEFFPTQLHERVNPLASVHGFERHQDPPLRGDLQHELVAQERTNQRCQLGRSNRFEIEAKLPALHRFHCDRTRRHGTGRGSHQFQEDR